MLGLGELERFGGDVSEGVDCLLITGDLLGVGLLTDFEPEEPFWFDLIGRSTLEG